MVSENWTRIEDRVHTLKIDPKNLAAILRGDKRCEVRCDDRGGFQPDDVLRLHAWTLEGGYTGDEAFVLVTDVLTSENAPKSLAERLQGLAVMSIRVIGIGGRRED